MQGSSITLIFVLCLMGGAIAYFGDQLGRRLGKKRLHLGGLRPKHFAALATTGAGFLIPIATIGLMSFLFSDVREMLFRTQAIKEELRHAEGSLRVTKSNLDIRTNEIASLEGDKRTLVREGEDLRKTNQETTIRLGSTNQLLKTAQSQLASRSKQLASLSSRTKQLSVRVTQLLGQVNQNIKQLQFLKQEAQAAQQTAKTNQEQANAAARELRDIQRRNLEIEKQNDELTQERKRLEDEVNSQKVIAKSLSDELDAQVQRAQSDLAGLRRQQEGLQGQITFLQNLMLQQANVSRTQPMVVARGFELARWIIEPNSSRTDAQNGLSSLMRTCRVRAEAKGAKAVGDDEAASLFRGDFSPEQQINNILRDVTSQPEPMVMIASALFNHFAGEPVYYQVETYPNSIVYQRGQVIAETRIDGSQDERKILEAIGRFIRDVVGPKALEDKMLPVVGADAPLGEVNDDQVVALMREVKDYGRTVRVQAQAAGETRRSDRLQLEFRLR